MNPVVMKKLFGAAGRAFCAAENSVGKTGAEKKEIAISAVKEEIQDLLPDNLDDYADMAIEFAVKQYNKAKKKK